MRSTPGQWISTVTTIIVVALAVWWWQGHMVYEWQRIDNEDALHGEEAMRAATQLLELHGYKVLKSPNLGEALVGHPDTALLILTRRDGQLGARTGSRLTEWVARGGTLVIEALESTDKSRGQDAVTQATNVVNEYFARHTPADAQDGYAVTPPGLDHRLKLNTHNWYLHSTAQTPKRLWGDNDESQWLVLAFGTGRIVLTPFNRFDNYELYQQDHAELLLHMASLVPKGRVICFVRSLETPPWYVLLWENVPYGLVALLLFIVLVLWVAVVRFGPVLPEASTTRRALMEHIDASARWLWQTAAGREAMLQALRRAVLSQLGRRKPEWLRLKDAELAQRIAEERSLPIRLIDEALNRPAGTRHLEFVRQIRTLQDLRKHHER